jgi:hypothetical protein
MNLDTLRGKEQITFTLDKELLEKIRILDTLRGKEQITFTLDKELLEKIRILQKKEQVISLSSLINQMLWEQVGK